MILFLNCFLVLSNKITFYFCPIANEMCGEINGEKLLYIKEEEMKIVILDCLSKKKNFVKVARLYLVIER